MQPVRSNEHESIGGLCIGRQERLKSPQSLRIAPHIEEDPYAVVPRNDCKPWITTGIDKVAGTGH